MVPSADEQINSGELGYRVSWEQLTRGARAALMQAPYGLFLPSFSRQRRIPHLRPSSAGVALGITADLVLVQNEFTKFYCC